jgi:hypothetical protein
MKIKQAVSFIAVCLFLITNSAANSPESQLLFSLTSDNKARVGIINTSAQALTLAITNKDGEVFFETTAKSGTNYFKLIDLNNLTDGEYIVRMKGLNKEVRKRFVVSNKQITMKAEVKPTFKITEEGTLLIYYRNSEQRPVDITFYQNNEAVFETKSITDAVVSKSYVLNKMPKGSYTVTVVADNERFNYDLVIK